MSTTRRSLLQTPVLLVGGALASRAAPNDSDLEDFRGVFPIMQTPYDDAGDVDFDTLAAEAAFLDRAGVHGMVWPQLASEYSRLSFDERLRGAETVVAAARGLKPKVVIGVQGPDTETAVQDARHADKLGPDAVIALPPRKGDEREFDLAAVRDYYQAVGRACGLPLFIQAIGNISVEFILELMKTVPTLRFVKDEAGDTLTRISRFRRIEGSARPLVFTGGHGRTLIDEMARGSDGNMPASGWADLYVSVWELWRAGFRSEAIDVFSKIMLFVTQAGAYGLASLSYVLRLRGVFHNWKVRTPNQRPLDAESREALRRTYEFVKPYLRA